MEYYLINTFQSTQCWTRIVNPILLESIEVKCTRIQDAVLMGFNSLLTNLKRRTNNRPDLEFPEEI